MSSRQIVLCSVETSNWQVTCSEHCKKLSQPHQGILLHIGLHLGTLGIYGFLSIFLNFCGIFWIFGQILRFLAPGRSESCRRLRDLQKSIVILSNGAVWTRNVTLLMKTLPPKQMLICCLVFWLWGGRGCIDASEISRNPSLFCQAEPSEPET